MKKLTKEWIKEHVYQISAFNGTLDKQFVLDRAEEPQKGFQTNLPQADIEDIESHTRRSSFLLYIPCSDVWATAWGYYDPKDTGKGVNEAVDFARAFFKLPIKSNDREDAVEKLKSILACVEGVTVKHVEINSVHTREGVTAIIELRVNGEAVGAYSIFEEGR